ncbi:MAG: hypothetical protein NTY48_03860 [Candidatus Diapherotrites archaeon]|nr:hypothetical protein [Candidatus Diapherotrites archaeon]
MDDKTIAQICVCVTIIGILLFVLTYKEEFSETTITELLKTKGAKGIIFGRIDYLIKNYPITQFVLEDGNTATIYYPKATSFEENMFVKVYAENDEKETKSKNLYAHKVVVYK